MENSPQTVHFNVVYNVRWLCERERVCARTCTWKNSNCTLKWSALFLILFVFTLQQLIFVLAVDHEIGLTKRKTKRRWNERRKKHRWINNRKQKYAQGIEFGRNVCVLTSTARSLIIITTNQIRKKPTLVQWICLISIFLSSLCYSFLVLFYLGNINHSLCVCVCVCECAVHSLCFVVLSLIAVYSVRCLFSCPLKTDAYVCICNTFVCMDKQ